MLPDWMHDRCGSSAADRLGEPTRSSYVEDFSMHGKARSPSTATTGWATCPVIFLCLLFLALTALPAAAQTSPRPSWRDMALGMLGEGKLDSAQYFYEKWVEADPRDEGSWYNLACVYALSGEREKALDAFESSVAAGWDDPEHPMNDGDLESIRSEPRFLAAIDSVRHAARSDGPEGFIRRFVETRTIATYITMLPDDYDESDRTYPLCVILHGSGSTELGHGRIADMVGREGVIYIAPRALNGRIVGEEMGYTAWPTEEIDSLDPLYTRSAPNYAELVRACIEDARRTYRVDPGRVMIIGHSQGAAFSYITAATYPDLVGSIFSYAGYFPEEFRTPAHLQRLREEDVHITLAHGTADNSVDVEESRTMEGILKEEGIDVEAHFFEGVNHFIQPEVREAMIAWMKSQLGE